MSAKHWGGAPTITGARRLYPQQYPPEGPELVERAEETEEEAEERLLPPEAELLPLELPPMAQTSVLQAL